MKIVNQIIQLLTCCLLVIAIGINKNHKIIGISLEKEQAVEAGAAKDEWKTNDGFRVISTRNMAKDIWGYGGNVPLLVYMKGNRIDHIEMQGNSESPQFLSEVVHSGLLSAWNGLTPEEMLNRNTDAVTGATLSSNAIILSVRKAMAYAENRDAENSAALFRWDDIRFWCVLIVVLSGIIIPFFCKNKYFRMGQQIMNVVVLGFWSGSFISLSLLVNYFSNGLNLWTSLIPILLLIAAFVLPLFGKREHYCTWLCPLGSCQELIGKAIPYKIRLSPKMIRNLTDFREGLWILMMAVMWLGAGFELMDYELFSAFLFRQASIPLIIMALVFALLSGVMQRPYCRFVCPTGSLIKFSQQIK